MAACKLCIRPDQQAVAAAFAAGLSDRAIGRRFGVSHMAARAETWAH